MIDRLLALFAFVILACFLGILAWRVPRLDLGIVIGVTLLFVAYDFFVAFRRRS
jgi:hypothetical protein